MRISHDDTDDRFTKPGVAVVSGERTFAMFCTWEDGCFLFAEVADEIAAVAESRAHVAFWGDLHISCIHMEPMRDAWSVDEFYEPDEIDRAANLFRQPAEVTSGG